MRVIKRHGDSEDVSFDKILNRITSLSVDNPPLNQINIDALSESDFILVTGIADSSYLVEFLKSKAFNFKHLKYSDHYNFNKLSIDKIRNISSGKRILTTEKDFGRLKPKISDRDIYYIEVSMQFNSELNELNFDKTISEYIDQN